MFELQTLIKRGEIVESEHKIKCLVKKYDCGVIFSTNNDEDIIYPMSSIKVFQAIPLILSKAKEENVHPREISEKYHDIIKLNNTTENEDATSNTSKLTKVMYII